MNEMNKTKQRILAVYSLKNSTTITAPELAETLQLNNRTVTKYLLELVAAGRMTQAGANYQWVDLAKRGHQCLLVYKKRQVVGYLYFQMMRLTLTLLIQPKAELRIDVFRASGAGGQHVNRTESAVRIVHLPTGVVVQCQNDRSQHKNRSTAMKQLKAKLYELEMQKRRSQQQLVEDNKAEIGWGNQIRSYVLDQSRIKDLRTGVEIANTQAVLDGDLDEFMVASLKKEL